MSKIDGEKIKRWGARPEKHQRIEDQLRGGEIPEDL